MLILEVGRDMPAKQEYSYARRAQAVTYSLHWKQVATCEDYEELESYARDLMLLRDYSGARFKIVSNGKSYKAGEFEVSAIATSEVGGDR